MSEVKLVKVYKIYLEAVQKGRSLFLNPQKVLSEVKTTRNRYINEAIDFYNKIQQRKLLEEKLRKESKLIGNDSLAVLKEFERFTSFYNSLPYYRKSC